MNKDRLSIPQELKRAVLIEAGHRCSIPTCKNFPVDIHHIEPYEECQEHTFDNLIALCCNCHARHHRNKDIDRKSLQIYKANLGLLNHRYGEIERRILQHFCDHPQESTTRLPGLNEIHVQFFLRDNILIKTGNRGGIEDCGVVSWEEYSLTEHGKVLVESWKGAQLLK